MTEINLALPQADMTPNAALPANGKTCKPSSGKKGASFGAILDSAADAGTETGKGDGKTAANDNLAFLALNGIVLASLPTVVNTQEQAIDVDQAASPATLNSAVNPVSIVTANQEVISNASEVKVATANETPAIPIPAHQAIAAPDFSYLKNDNAAVQQTVVNLPAAPANAQNVQPEQAGVQPEPVGSAVTVTPQQAAIVNDLLRNNNEQTTGNIAGNDLTVLSVKANPVVTTTIVQTIKDTDSFSKKEGAKSSELDNSIPLPAENNLETVVTPVAAKEAVKPGKEEQQETFSQTNQPERSAALTDSDVTADYAKVETGVNRQVIVGEHVPIANFARTVEGSSPTASQLTAGVPEDPHNIAGQIVEQARMINRVNNSEMIVKLKPEHLGELTLKVTVENGAVSASFHSNNSEVRTIIEASLTQLKQELSTQGLKVENVGVYAGLNQSFSNEQQQQAAQQQQIKFKNRRQEENFINAIEAAAVLPTTSDAGVDYRI